MLITVVERTHRRATPVQRGARSHGELPEPRTLAQRSLLEGYAGAIGVVQCDKRVAAMAEQRDLVPVGLGPERSASSKPSRLVAATGLMHVQVTGWVRPPE